MNYNYKGKEYSLTKSPSDNDIQDIYTLMDGKQLVFKYLSILPLLRKDIEKGIDDYIINQRKSKLDEISEK